MAGDESVRTDSSSRSLTQSWNGADLTKEVNAQLQITSTFGQQASKAVGDYATAKYNELKDSNPAEAAKWAEGGEYRVAAHTVVGGLTGGVGGAVSAGGAAAAAPLIDQATSNLSPSVKGLVGAAVAAAIGAAGGGTGAVTAINTDANNRQLHPSESQWIKDHAKQYAQQRGITEAAAVEELGAQAYRQVQMATDGQWSDAASAFLNQARGMLPADPETPSLGATMAFRTSTQQRASVAMYASMLPEQADFYIAAGLKIPSAQAIAAAVAKDTQQREFIGQLTLGAGVASSIVALAGASPALLTWALSNPDKAVTIGLVTAETAAALATGAVTPTSVADSLGQSIGRGLSVAEKEAVQELTSTLKLVAQQRLLVEQPAKLNELTTLFTKGSGQTLEFAGQRLVATVESNISGSTKVFDTTGIAGDRLQLEIFSYVQQLTGGRALQRTTREGVWSVESADGMIVNARTISTSGVSRWTVEIQRNSQPQLLQPSGNIRNYEIKFK